MSKQSSVHVFGAKNDFQLTRQNRAPPAPHQISTLLSKKEKPEPGKLFFYHLQTTFPGSHRTVFLNVYSFTAPQTLHELALLSVLAATMSFFEPPQVELLSLFEKSSLHRCA